MTEQQQDESKLERVIRKIKRCLALSQSSNENEAATAMRQAQSLMREYRLTEMDVRLSDVGEVESEMSRAKRRPTWDRHLSSIIGQAFGVRPLSRRSWCSATGRIVDRALFVGVNPGPQIAMYAYETLLAKLIQARREYVSRVRSGKQRSAYSPETAGDHFALAWVSAVHDKIHELVPRGEEDLASPQYSSGRDLVAVEAQDKALVEQYLAGKEIGKARKAREVELDLDAQIAGLLAGRRVQLNAGLASGGQDVLQLGKTG
ncbi:DUF2786 domain-containing protein [Pseudomonas protegens]|uniref:DUF2786 domain-containing protein n=1 Tax=Pseudomonas protegens TaxID=380021 RepID=UPI001B302C8B|nr:DUF2786 domain-containing protein [Pseudomonas protegens]MBP5119594.1 DUF2786 domain-containing protein [Pseudomonas protegens]QTU20654.1 DUF2786 domain-containing protein [Pseudomonas protegens]